MAKKIFLNVCAWCLLASCSVSQSGEERRTTVDISDPVFLHRTVKQVTDVIIYDIFSPPVASRIYVYMAIAAYEAAIHANPQYVSLAGQVKGLKPVPAPDPNEDYCFPLASVEAALTVGTDRKSVE